MPALFHGYNAKLEAPPCYGCTDSKVCSFTGCQSIQSVNIKLHPSHRTLMLSSNIKTNDQLMTTRLWGQCLSQLSIYMSTSQHWQAHCGCVKYTDPPPASGTCRSPLLVLAYMTSFSHVVGLQWMHELHQQTCCVKYTKCDPSPASGTCRPPLLVLAYMTSFSHGVGLQWMHVCSSSINPSLTAYVTFETAQGTKVK